ncbi:MAG: hypothetical protein IPN18_05290 [Ignavibacteriales bacterium]|nr:hypothetical protein [Ignavibacteriales bacterium]
MKLFNKPLSPSGATIPVEKNQSQVKKKPLHINIEDIFKSESTGNQEVDAIQNNGVRLTTWGGTYSLV